MQKTCNVFLELIPMLSENFCTVNNPIPAVAHPHSIVVIFEYDANLSVVIAIFFTLRLSCI